MTIRHFFASLAVALGVIAAFNVFLALKVDSVPKSIQRKMKSMPRIDILFLGNSLMQSGLDPEKFTAGWINPEKAPLAFNAGLGWSSPVEHYVLAHQSIEHHPEISCLIYGFRDFQLTSPEGYSWKELEGNRSMAYLMEPSVSASLYAPGSAWEEWRFRLIGAVPALREHSQLWKYVELLRRDLQQIGMPKAKTNEFGRVADFQTVAETDLAQFQREGEMAIARSAPFVPAIEKLIKMAREKKIRVIFVEMPVTAEHRGRYYATSSWQRYQAYLKNKMSASGVTYVAADDWVPETADFSDGLHLNSRGADLFSRKMATTLTNELKPKGL